MAIVHFVRINTRIQSNKKQNERSLNIAGFTKHDGKLQ